MRKKPSKPKIVKREVWSSFLRESCSPLSLESTDVLARNSSDLTQIICKSHETIAVTCD